MQNRKKSELLEQLNWQEKIFKLERQKCIQLTANIQCCETLTLMQWAWPRRLIR